MTRFSSLHGFGLLTWFLFVGIASPLHAQTIVNSDVASSGSDIPMAYGILRQESGDHSHFVPTPESILGHRLLFEPAARDATTQKAKGDYFITAGKVSSPEYGGADITHRYFVTDLGTLGGTESFAYAINDVGQVVGLSSTGGDASTHSFLYSNGRMTDLYPLNSQSILTAGPTGINNSGQIASGLLVGGVYSPAIFDSGTGLTLLGSLGGCHFLWL